MAEKRVVGKCDQCGGIVSSYKALLIVGPFPPPSCEGCGAETDVLPVVRMVRPCGGIGIHSTLKMSRPQGIEGSYPSGATNFSKYWL